MSISPREWHVRMSFYDLSTSDGTRSQFQFASLKGKVVVIVNVASFCGFTPQYKELETLHQRYKDDGLVILAFPCGQFGGQEMESLESIQEYVRRHFKVLFPILTKLNVNGDDTHAVYRYLKAQKAGELGFKGVRWNFEKFVVNRQGEVVERFGSAVTPLLFEPLLQQLLKA